MAGKKTGLYANIHAKQERIEDGSGEKMRKPGEKGAPSAKSFAKAEKSAKATGAKATPKKRGSK